VKGGEQAQSLCDVDAAVACAAELARHSPNLARQGISGARCSTFGIGGVIQYLVEPRNENELEAAVRVLRSYSMPWRILGAGSNVLLPDEGLPGFTLRLGREFRYCRPGGSSNEFEIGAAMSLMSLSRDLSDAGMSGLEFAGGIPASIGGAVTMNAGAHGGEMSSVLTSVRFIGPAGGWEELPAKELRFSYRHSVLPPGALVVGARVALAPGDRTRSSELRRTHLAERKSRQPLTLPSAGSVFKNPPGEFSAGELIERACLKGTRRGGASISSLHGNWIVNDTRNACAKDVQDLIRLCQERVAELFKVRLQPEVIAW
jgi:UDP-N-acetylmuramate dehydrogenase